MLRVSLPSNYLRIDSLTNGRPALVLVELKQKNSSQKKYRLYSETACLATYLHETSTPIDPLRDLESVSHYLSGLNLIEHRLRAPAPGFDKLNSPFVLSMFYQSVISNSNCLLLLQGPTKKLQEKCSRRRPSRKKTKRPPSMLVGQNAENLSITIISSDEVTSGPSIEILPESERPEEQADAMPENTPLTTVNPVVVEATTSTTAPTSPPPLSEPPSRLVVQEDDQPQPPIEQKNSTSISVTEFDHIISQYESSSKILAYFFNPYRSETIKNLRKLTSFDVSLVMLDDKQSIDAYQFPDSIPDNKPFLVRSKNNMYLYTSDKKITEIKVDSSVMKKLPFSRNAIINYTSAQFPPALAKWFSSEKLSFCQQKSLDKGTIQEQIKSSHRLNIFSGNQATIKLKNNTDRRIEALSTYFKTRC